MYHLIKIAPCRMAGGLLWYWGLGWLRWFSANGKLVVISTAKIRVTYVGHNIFCIQCLYLDLCHCKLFHAILLLFLVEVRIRGLSEFGDRANNIRQGFFF